MGKIIALACALVGCASQSSSSAETAQQDFVRNAYPVLVHGCGMASPGCHAETGIAPTFGGPGPTSAQYDALINSGYCGDFTASAPLITAHPNAAVPDVDPTVIAVIEQWLALEHQARGL